MQGELGIADGEQLVTSPEGNAKPVSQTTNQLNNKPVLEFKEVGLKYHI